MGASKPSTKGKSSKGKSGPAKSGANKPKSKPKPTGSAPEGISKRKQKSMSLAKPGGAQKTKSLVSKDGKKKRRVYSEKELDIPALNGIIPAGIAKPKGVKKGKKFVDDPASMVCSSHSHSIQPAATSLFVIVC
jgi:60S ribosomal subunit assembly/export protein LOC1